MPHIHTLTDLSKALTSVEKSFTRANISTNVDTLLKGTHITIKWNKEGTTHATLFFNEKKSHWKKGMT